MLLNDLIGKTYERGGKTPGTYDCRSLFIEVMNRFGHDVQVSDIGHTAVEHIVAAQALKEYAYTETDAKIIEQDLQNGKWQKLDEPEPGCAVCIALDPLKPQRVQHLGVYIGDNKFIHVVENHGVITTKLNDLFFRRKIRGYYKWIG
jgi:cell wall-associated NlpC family hydrolase